MNKVILIQCPEKFHDVVPIFCQEALKHNIFDKIYITLNNNKFNYKLPDKCYIIPMKQDNQFATNIINALECVEEKLLLLCCEDHVMIEDHSKDAFDECFDFVVQSSKIGSLRLTYNSKVKFKDSCSDQFAELNRKYSYYTSLQPTVWKKDYLLSVLKHGEDAWETELQGTKRASQNMALKAYCVKKTIYKATNFYKSGKYMRHYFADYIATNNLDIPNKYDVFEKKEGNKNIISLKDYLAK